MATKPPIDPLAIMQALAAAWKQVVPAAPVPPPLPTAMPAADAAAARMMAQSLAAANMPSREEVAAIAARLDRIEQSLARIELAQADQAARRRRKA